VSKPVHILGLSAFYHDSAACLLRDGVIVAAAQEERFTRRKHDERFPENAVAYCLLEGGLTLGDVDHVAFYEKPFLKFDRLLHTYLAEAPRGLASFLKAMPVWLKDKLWQKAELAERLQFAQPIFFPEHHESLLSVPLRRGGDPHRGWRRRVGDDQLRGGSRQPDRAVG
jgi:carbamoyltransferase